MWLEPCDPDSVSSPYVGTPPAVAEGSPCPTCKRRVPYKKKPSSPQTEVFSTRVPIGDKDDFNEMIDAAAAHRDLAEKPHHRYWTLLQGLVLLLQGPSGEEG
jgi:hypothetical protein